MKIVKYLLVAQSVLLLSCNKSDPEPPKASADDVYIARSTSASTLEFVVNIDKSASSDVSIQYAENRAGTAIATRKFCACLLGVLTISAESKTFQVL